MRTIRLTMAQALTRYLARQMTEIDADWDVVDVAEDCVAAITGHQPVEDAAGDDAGIVAAV